MQDEIKMTSKRFLKTVFLHKYSDINTPAPRFEFLNMHYVLIFIQQSLLEKFLYCGGSPQINLCETHPTAQTT